MTASEIINVALNLRIIMQMTELPRSIKFAVN